MISAAVLISEAFPFSFTSSCCLEETASTDLLSLTCGDDAIVIDDVIEVDEEEVVGGKRIGVVAVDGGETVFVVSVVECDEGIIGVSVSVDRDEVDTALDGAAAADALTDVAFVRKVTFDTFSFFSCSAADEGGGGGREVGGSSFGGSTVGGGRVGSSDNTLKGLFADASDPVGSNTTR